MASAGNGRRVLIIVQNLPVPFDRRVWLEATSLTAAGYAVSVICPKAKGYNESFERLEGVDIYRYGLPIDAQGALGFVMEFAWCFLRTFMKSVRIAVAGRGFDVIHACNPPETFWLLGWFWRLFGKRFLFDHHDLSPEMYAAKFQRESGPMYRGLLFLERMTFRTADVVITTNESHKRVAQQRGGLAADDVYIVRSGPDLDRFKVYEPDPSWKRGKAQLLVYLGEMCKQDGVDHLVRALAALRDDFGHDDFHAVFVGGGPEQPLIKAYAAEIGVADLCTFTGRVSDEDLCRILSSADVAVDPDPKNDWSDKSTMNKIMEYMFFGLPIVAYELTEHRVSAEDAAVYAEPNSERALAEAISDLLRAPERRRRMSEYGAKRVREKLVWQHSVPPLLAAYDAIFRRFFAGRAAAPAEGNKQLGVAKDSGR
ncbi:MAG: glycosyltransferase [Alphaproteobacteria bacterium]|nr:glycosyltransferase [Alphaproteobacteria bacterium]